MKDIETGLKTIAKSIVDNFVNFAHFERSDNFRKLRYLFTSGKRNAPQHLDFITFITDSPLWVTIPLCIIYTSLWGVAIYLCIQMYKK